MQAGALEQFRAVRPSGVSRRARRDRASIEFSEILHAGPRDNMYLLVEQARDESKLALQRWRRPRVAHLPARPITGWRGFAADRSRSIATIANRAGLRLRPRGLPISSPPTSLLAAPRATVVCGCPARMVSLLFPPALQAFRHGSPPRPRSFATRVFFASTRSASGLFFAAAVLRARLRPGFGARPAGFGALFCAALADAQRLAGFGRRVFGALQRRPHVCGWARFG